MGAPNSPIAAFLAGLADGVRGPVADGRHVAVVVAHPDDETIGCGATLARLDGVTLIVVTDGAPRDLADAKAHGFATASAYAARRALELGEASRIALVDRRNLLEFGLPDQCATHEVETIARGLARALEARRIRIVITHAFEGGHPDHDGVALAVAAARMLRARDGNQLDVIEMPFYRKAADGGMQVQSFAGRIETCASGPQSQSDTSSPTVLRLDARERWIKRSMARAHRTQAAMLAAFDLSTERFRPASRRPTARHFLEAPPNGGAVLYADRAWGVRDYLDWRDLAERALARLGLGGRGGS